MVNCPKNSAENRSMLEAPFEPQEILESIKVNVGEKAPGPDGYSMEFFIQYQDMYSTQACLKQFTTFMKDNFFEKSLNAIFVALKRNLTRLENNSLPLI